MEEIVNNKVNINALMEWLQKVLMQINNLIRWWNDKDYRDQLRSEHEAKRLSRREEKRAEKIKGFNIIRRELEELKEQVNEANEQGALTQEAVNKLTDVVINFSNKLDKLETLDEKTIKQTVESISKELDNIQSKNEKLLTAQYTDRSIVSTIQSLVGETSVSASEFAARFSQNARILRDKATDKLAIEFEGKNYLLDPEITRGQDTYSRMKVNVKETGQLNGSLEEINPNGKDIERVIFSELAKSKGYIFKPQLTALERFARNLEYGSYNTRQLTARIEKGDFIVENAENNDVLIFKTDKNGALAIDYIDYKGDGEHTYHIGKVQPDGKGNIQVTTSYGDDELRKAATTLLECKAAADYMTARGITADVRSSLFAASDEMIKSLESDFSAFDNEAQEHYNTILAACKESFGQDGNSIQTVGNNRYINVKADDSKFGFAFNAKGDIATVNIYDDNAKKYVPIFYNTENAIFKNYFDFGDKAKAVLQKASGIIALDPKAAHLYDFQSEHKGNRETKEISER